MIEFLAIQVRIGKITVEQIPERLRIFVQERLISMRDSELLVLKEGE